MNKEIKDMCNLNLLLTMQDNVLQGLAMALAPYLMPYFDSKVKDEIASVHTKDQSGDDLISKNEVCSKLGVSTATLWRWDKANYLKPIKIGGKLMYRKEDLNKLSK